jgi:hypothetical protein
MMKRIVEWGGARRLRRRRRHDPAVSQPDRRFRDGGDLRIVGDQHERGAAGAVNLQQQLDHLAARRTIEVAGRLVGQQDRGIVGERPGDCDPLLLAARQLRRVVMRAIRQPHFGEQRARAGRRIGAVGNLDRHQHVLERGQRRQQVKGLEDEPDARSPQPRQVVLAQRGDVDAVDQDAPARGRVEPGDQPEQRRLAAAGRADDRDHPALGDRQVGGMQDRQRAAAARHGLRNAAQLDHCEPAI